MIKSDIWIIEQCEKNELLKPFVTESVCKDENGARTVSHGPSSYGYDVTLDDRLKIFNPYKNLGVGAIIDPTNFDETIADEIVAKEFILPPYSFALGVTREYFKMPRNIMGKVWNKSTWARSGLMIYPTLIEPGWEGNLVLEFANNTPFSMRLKAGQGIAQVTFEEGDGVCKTSYADRGGKYMNQTGVQTPL